MKLAHVTTIALSQRYLLLNQMRAQRDAGYRVAGVSSAGPDTSALDDAGIPHHAVEMTRRMTPLRDLRSVDAMARLFQRERFAIVHTHNPKPAVLGQLAARLAGVPVVMHTIHGFWWHEHMKPWVRQACIDVDRVASSWSDLIFSQSAEDIETAVRERVAPRDKLVHIGNGIDVRRFKRNPFARARIRSELGLEERDLVIGFVGRLVAEKGLPELLEAFATLRRTPSAPRAKLVIVGEADLEKADAFRPETWPTEASRHGISVGDVVFTGHRTDVADLYAAFDVFTLPSHREGVPRSPMEASACGVPVVATRIRGCREVIVDGTPVTTATATATATTAAAATVTATAATATATAVPDVSGVADADANGLLVPVRDPVALARALQRLLEDREERVRMGRAGESMARARFDERDVFARVIEGYARALRSRGLESPARSHAATRERASEEDVT